MKKILIALMIFAIITRFAFLEQRPMDHDESVHAWISLKNVVESPSYSYDPAFHGPFLYFVISLTFLAFGDSDFSARFPVAIFSIIGVFFAFKFERWFGKSAYIFALFMIFSPSILYYSRYARDDIIVLSSFIAFLYFYLLYREKRELRNAIFAVIFLVVIFTSKENWVQYFTVVFLALTLYRYMRRDFTFDRNIIPCIVLFIFLSSFFYSSAFAYAINGKNWVEVILSRDWIDRFFEKSIPYWFSQGLGSAHEKPIHYFINILLRYEFLALALAIASFPLKIERKFEFYEIFAICWLVIAFLFYHAMAYKTPWLVVHLVTPLVFFAIVFIRRDFFDNRDFKITFAIGLIVTSLISVQVTYFEYNNVLEQPLIYVQTQEGAIKMANRIRDLVSQGYSVAIFAVDGHYWPMPWVLRDEKVIFTTTCPRGYDYVFAARRDYRCLSGYEIVANYELRKYWEFYELRKI
ncbi:MAG: TIGR03663 family protein [Archaeoglobaceae archaeon]|nr:TIGR03663 family protein [Archaeoglobaceae archaeon]MDW7989455.1 TIGR03663 family protein [Archaeoglobaceae archaeon]